MDTEHKPSIIDPDSRAVIDSQFRKNNDTIALRVVEGKFTLLSRKLYNVFVAHAQSSGAPGVGAPLNTAAAAGYFWIPLGELAKDSDFTSRDSQLIKEHAEALSNIRIVVETEKEWTSERLLSGVKIVNTKGIGNKNGSVFLGYAFPPEVEQMVLAPSTFTKLSLYYQAQFKTGATLSLYEATRRYLTSPSHLTARKPWKWWWCVLTGNPITEDMTQYKYFKRDYLQPAIDEINALTDIHLTLEVFKNGRATGDLQFTVTPTKRKSDKPVSFNAPIVDSIVIERILRLGITQEEAKKIFSAYEVDEIVATLDLIDVRIKNKKSAPIESPSGYFKTALKNGYAKTPNLAQPTAGAVPKPANDLQEQVGLLKAKYEASRAREAFGYYGELDEVERLRLTDEFSEATDKSTRTYFKKRGLDMGVVKTAFGLWLAMKLWGEITDSDVLGYIASGTLDSDESKVTN